KKDNIKPSATITVKVRYYQSQGQPFAADEGSKVYLLEHTFEDFDKSFELMMSGNIKLKKCGQIVGPKYSATTDENGIAILNNVKQGKYFIIVAGNGAQAYSYKTIDINSTQMQLSKSFSWESIRKENGETW